MAKTWTRSRVGVRAAGFLIALRRVHLPLALVVGLGVSLSLAGYLFVEHLHRTRAQSEFDGPASQYATAVTRALDRDLEIVKSVGAFFSASNEVDRWEFFEFARETLPRHRGLQAIEWIPSVSAEARPGVEQLARDDGLFGFKFNELDTFGNRVAAAPRSEHFPIYFVEPFEGNERELGRDLAAFDNLKEDLLVAGASGTMVVSRRLGAPLTHGQVELVVVQPVYRSGQIPDTEAERRAELLGFARGVFRLGDLVQAALPALAQPLNLDVYLFSKAQGVADPLIYFNPSPLSQATREPLAPNAARDGLFHAMDYRLADQDWQVLVRPSNRGLWGESWVAAWAVFTIGILLTALLSQYLVAARSRTRAIERAVTERTAELRETNVTLEREIEQRSRIEDELRSAKDKAESASRTKTEFLAIMGHELRTPLNTVIGFADILEKETYGPLGDQRYLDYSRDIRASGESLLTSINHVLDLTRIEAGEYTLQVEPQDVTRLLKSVSAKVAPLVEQAQLKFHLTVAEDIPFLIADWKALQQSLLDLLSNAIKFTPHNGTVTLAAEASAKSGLLIRVSDSGIGIAGENLERILKPFNQTDQSLSRHYEGTGLGLPLATKIVELHGGRLSIESQIGTGTDVHLTFPAPCCKAREDSTKVA